MIAAEPPPEGGVAPPEGLQVPGVPSVPPPQQPQTTRVAVPVPSAMMSLVCPNPAIDAEPVTTTTEMETVTTFKTGALSVRKDMMARLPAMHISNFKRNIRDLSTPSIMINELNLTSANTKKLALCEGSERVLTTPNAGGNSVWSEVLSMEMMSMLYCAKLKATEMEIEYMMEGSITDYSVFLGDAVVGVSVTRAMKYRGVFSYEDAVALLTKKMKGVMKSSENVVEDHKWSKQVLHVWVQEPYMVALVQKAYAALPELWSNTVVLLTVCGENMGWIFK